MLLYPYRPDEDGQSRAEQPVRPSTMINLRGNLGGYAIHDPSIRPPPASLLRAAHPVTTVPRSPYPISFTRSARRAREGGREPPLPGLTNYTAAPRRPSRRRRTSHQVNLTRPRNLSKGGGLAIGVRRASFPNPNRSTLPLPSVLPES